MPVSKMLVLVIPLCPSCQFYLCFLPLKDWRRILTTPFSFFSVPLKPGGLIAEQTAIGFKIPLLAIGALWRSWFHSGVKCPWNDLLFLFSGSICIAPLNSVALIIRWMFNFLHHWPHQRVLPFKVFPSYWSPSNFPSDCKACSVAPGLYWRMKLQTNLSEGPKKMRKRWNNIFEETKRCWNRYSWCKLNCK